ncbi:MAG: ABC transporter permease [Bacilli bacterium]|nr:ABC transporter permease [Bacilli bacterium]
MSKTVLEKDKNNLESNEAKAPREKLFHIAKRMDVSLQYKIIVRVISIVTALLMCAFVLNIFKPGKFFTIFSSSFNALTGSTNKFFITLDEFAILLGISIAILPAFKMKFWNLGAEGQILIGGLAAVLVSKYIGPYVPNVLCTILMLIFAIIAGGVWALIPAFFKAKFNTNETLFTLMMNYLAMGFIAFFEQVIDPAHGTIAQLTNGTFPDATDNVKTIIAFVIVVLMTLFMFGYLNKTKHGYELTVVGETRNTAKYIGINVKAVIMRTVVLCGILCGIIGYFTVLKQKSISPNIIGGKGFTAVMIAWLGHMNVVEVIVMAFLVAFITRGSSVAATNVDLGSAFTNITIAIFLITILAFEFFLNYEVHFNKKIFKSKKEVKEVEE